MLLSVVKLSALWPFGIVLVLEIVDIFKEKTFKNLINKHTICFYGAFSIFIIKQLLLYHLDRGVIYFMIQLLFGIPFAFLLITYCFYRMIPLLISLLPGGTSRQGYIVIQQQLEERSRMFWFILMCTVIYTFPHLLSLIILSAVVLAES
jgi:hypothetical protein